MARTWKVFDCEDCGAPTRRKRDPWEPKVCLGCGLERANAAAVQMAARKGPKYDAWLATAGPTGGRGKP